MGVLIAERDVLKKDLQDYITKNVYLEQIIKAKDKEKDELLAVYQNNLRQYKEMELELQREKLENQNKTYAL
jgi:hypothetical protein